MKKILCYVLVGMLFSITVSAKTLMESRQTSGFGSDYQQALAAALLEAVRQVRGLEIGTEKRPNEMISAARAMLRSHRGFQNRHMFPQK